MARYQAQFVDAKDGALDIYLTDDCDSFAEALKDIAEYADVPEGTVRIEIDPLPADI